jgi:hypothetical protein
MTSFKVLSHHYQERLKNHKHLKQDSHVSLLDCNTLWSCNWMPLFWRQLCSSEMSVSTCKSIWHYNLQEQHQHFTAMRTLDFTRQPRLESYLLGDSASP